MILMCSNKPNQPVNWPRRGANLIKYCIWLSEPLLPVLPVDKESVGSRNRLTAEGRKDVKRIQIEQRRLIKTKNDKNQAQWQI